MVLIEQVAEPEPESKSTGAEVKPISGSKSHDDRLTGREDDTDGFETASEGEISDHDDNINNNNEDSSQQNQTHQDQNQQHREKAEAEAEDDEAGMELTAKHEDELNKANDLKLDGNKLFGEGLYDEALSKYELAVQIAAGDTLAMKEIRATCHANRAICFLKLEKYEETIKECTKALELNPEYLKALIRRGEAHEKLEHYEEAIADMEAILKLDPGHLQSRRGIARLKPLSDEKKEKMKEEMIGKLKEMGNSVLGRFGMSVDNFKAVKDPNTVSSREQCVSTAKWATAPDAGQLIAMLLGLINAKKTIEIGVFTGYSALLTALSIPPDGKIVAIDANKDNYEMGLPVIKKAGVEHKIEFIHSKALPILDELLETHGNGGSFDFAFVDADKGNYMNYHERLMKLVRVGGLIVYDNTLWGGSVGLPEDPGAPETAKQVRRLMIELTDMLAADTRIQISHVPLGDGMIICKRLI